MFALTQMEDFVLWLSSWSESVCSCWQGCLAQQQRQQQRQKQEQRRSRHSHHLPQNHRSAHIPRYLYQAASVLRCTYTGTRTAHTQTQLHTSGDNELCHNKGRALDSSPVALSFHYSWEKGDSGESHQHFHVHIVCSQHTNMRARQRQHYCTQTSHHVTWPIAVTQSPEHIL